MHANACPLSGEPAQWSHRFGWMRFLSEPQPAQRCWGCTTAGMRTLILISITSATSPGAPPALSTSAQTPPIATKTGRTDPAAV